MSKTLGAILVGAAVIGANIVLPGSGLLVAASGAVLLGSSLLFRPTVPKPEQAEQAVKTSRPPRVSGCGIARLHGAWEPYE